MDFYNDTRREHFLMGVLTGVILSVVAYYVVPFIIRSL